MELDLQGASRELQEKLETMLEDKKEDEELTTNSKEVEGIIGLLVKRERKNDMVDI